MPHKQGKEPGLDDADYFDTFKDLVAAARENLAKHNFYLASYKLELESLRAWLDNELKRLATTDTPF